jgi:hypothetical protein
MPSARQELATANTNYVLVPTSEEADCFASAFGGERRPRRVDRRCISPGRANVAD